MKRMFELLVILIKKRILKSPTWLSHSKVSFQGPTPWPQPMVPPKGPTPVSQSMVPPQGPVLRSHPRVSPQGPGSWVTSQGLGRTFPVCFKWDISIPSSLRLLLKVWIWYRCQNRKLLSPWWRTIRFLWKKVHIKTYSKRLYIARNKEFQFIWQELY